MVKSVALLIVGDEQVVKGTLLIFLKWTYMGFVLLPTFTFPKSVIALSASNPIIAVPDTPFVDVENLASVHVRDTVTVFAPVVPGFNLTSTEHEVPFDIDGAVQKS
jgi:hypothetical protein